MSKNIHNLNEGIKDKILYFRGLGDKLGGEKSGLSKLIKDYNTKNREDDVEDFIDLSHKIVEELYKSNEQLIEKLTSNEIKIMNKKTEEMKQINKYSYRNWVDNQMEGYGSTNHKKYKSRLNTLRNVLINWQMQIYKKNNDNIISSSDTVQDIKKKITATKKYLNNREDLDNNENERTRLWDIFLNRFTYNIDEQPPVSTSEVKLEEVKIEEVKNQSVKVEAEEDKIFKNENKHVDPNSNIEQVVEPKSVKVNQNNNAEIDGEIDDRPETPKTFQWLSDSSDEDVEDWYFNKKGTWEIPKQADGKLPKPSNKRTSINGKFDQASGKLKKLDYSSYKKYF